MRVLDLFEKLGATDDVEFTTGTIQLIDRGARGNAGRRVNQMTMVSSLRQCSPPPVLTLRVQTGSGNPNSGTTPALSTPYVGARIRIPYIVSRRVLEHRYYHRSSLIPSITRTSSPLSTSSTHTQHFTFVFLLRHISLSPVLCLFCIPL